MADADRLALELMMAISGMDGDERASAMRVRERSLKEASGRIQLWDTLDEAAQITGALDLGMAALSKDTIMSQADAVNDDSEWYFLEDRGLFNCAALALMASRGKKRAMLRVSTEMDVPPKWWAESAFASQKLGNVVPIVLESVDKKRGTREYINLSTGARMTDSVNAQSGTRIQKENRGAIDAPIPDAQQLARATDTNAAPDAHSGKVWLLLLMMLICGGALYGLYSLIFSLIR